MTARSLVLSVLLAGLAAACGRSPVRLETRNFALRYLSSAEAQQIVLPYIFTDRPGANGAMSASRTSITVRETPDNLDRIGRILEEYDRPQPSVQLTFKVIRADGAAPRDTTIRDVEAALRSLFRFKGYALVAEGVVTSGSYAHTEQTLAGPGGPYRLRTGVERVAGAGDSTVVTLEVQLLVPRSGGRFETTVGIPVGKTAVLGNVESETPDRALILTVRPELMRD
jgi:hypothetical protein